MHPRSYSRVCTIDTIYVNLFLNCAYFWDGPKLFVILNAIPPGLFRASSLSKSFNFPRQITYDPVFIIFTFNVSKLS